MKKNLLDELIRDDFELVIIAMLQFIANASRLDGVQYFANKVW